MSAQPEPARRVSPWWLLPPSLLFLLNFAAAATAGSSGERNGVYKASYLGAALVTSLVLLGYAVLAVTVSGGPIRELLAVRRVPLRRAVKLAAAAFAVALTVSLLLEPLLSPDKAQGVTPQHTPRDGREWLLLAASLVLLGLIVPVCEELFFRGFGFAAAGAHALPVTSVMFAVAHAYPAVLPIVLVAGFALGEVRRRSDSVLPGMMAHAAFNITGLLVALATT